ncbi:hypothetical protein CCR75_007131 [Bremia lactucae]|uniref:RxLR effector protein n=1 Tax=Bremia lactucae TaxID=4779 RepID=A0A976FGD6_BRELC|nr:hypothetical protein CCR75_007131 [Bremia lactucae]
MRGAGLLVVAVFICISFSSFTDAQDAAQVDKHEHKANRRLKPFHANSIVTTGNELEERGIGSRITKMFSKKVEKGDNVVLKPKKFSWGKFFLGTFAGIIVISIAASCYGAYF